MHTASADGKSTAPTQSISVPRCAGEVIDVYSCEQLGWWTKEPAVIGGVDID